MRSSKAKSAVPAQVLNAANELASQSFSQQVRCQARVQRDDVAAIFDRPFWESAREP